MTKNPYFSPPILVSNSLQTVTLCATNSHTHTRSCSLNNIDLNSLGPFTHRFFFFSSKYWSTIQLLCRMSPPLSLPLFKAHCIHIYVYKHIYFKYVYISCAATNINVYLPPYIHIGFWWKCICIFYFNFFFF